MLRTTPEMNGREIDLIDDDGFITTHSEVRTRHLEGETSYVAVYPDLREGTYTVAETGQRVVIVGGRVSDVAYGTDESFSSPGSSGVAEVTSTSSASGEDPSSQHHLHGEGSE